MRSRAQIPSSHCPACGFLLEFDEVDFYGEPGTSAVELGHNSTIVCPACAEVLVIEKNLTLAIDENEVRRSLDEVIAMRKLVVERLGIELPDDLKPKAAPGEDALGWRIDVDGPYPVASTLGFPGAVELIATSMTDGVELIFELMAQAWPLVSEVPPFQSFTFTLLDGFRYMLLPVDGEDALDHGLDPDITWMQIIWEDQLGRWPWEHGGHFSTPISPTLLPTEHVDGDPVVLDFSFQSPSDDREHPVLSFD